MGGGRRPRVDLNPGGLCMCGCGGFAGRAGPGSTSGGHNRFLPGHHSRKSPVDYVERASGGGRAQHAHRWVYEAQVGPIPTGMELHHDCENALCVNPAHLTPITVDDHRALHAA